ncbi:MAG: ATP-binding protein [Chitinophagaceae bacterium]
MKKIVIIGPESTGKSTLCSQLANYYETVWVPEFAREFLLANGMNYSYDDLLTIAKGQLTLEDNIARDLTNDLLIIDTDMYVMKVWCEFVFGKCHHWIIDQIAIRRYDLYLLCNIDLAWVKDELREYPDLENRQRLYYIYKDILINQPVSWIDVRGNYDDRLQTAIKGINLHIKSVPLE